MVDNNLTIAMLTLKVNNLTIPIKRENLSEKTKPNQNKQINNKTILYSPFEKTTLNVKIQKDTEWYIYIPF